MVLQVCHPGSHSSLWLWPDLWVVCEGPAQLPSPAAGQFCPAWARHDIDVPNVTPNVPLSRGSPGPCGVSPAGAAHPHQHPWPWHAVKSSSRHPLGVPQGQAQPRGFSRVTLSQGPSHNLRTGLSEETQHSCTLLRSPRGRRNGLGPAAAPGRGFGLGGEYKLHPHNTAQCPSAPACDSPGSGDARGCSRTLSPVHSHGHPAPCCRNPVQAI